MGKTRKYLKPRIASNRTKRGGSDQVAPETSPENKKKQTRLRQLMNFVTRKKRKVNPDNINNPITREPNKIITYNDTSYYVGEITEKNRRFGFGKIEIRDGKGIMNYANGDVYEGEWVNNKRNGKGIMTRKNGDVYDGQWVDDKYNGKGTMTYSNGDVYEGEWLNDKYNGKGTMTNVNGDVYDGEWVDDKRHGKGIMKRSDGQEYDGEWSNGYRDGQGTMTVTITFRNTGQNNEQSKTQYIGKWLKDKRHGPGKMTYANGDVYDGEWVNDKPDGQGKMTYNPNYNSNNRFNMYNKEHNYKEYDGQWKEGQISGQGKMMYKNGDVYDGEWADDERKGKGEIKYSDGDTYVGDWYDDKREGQGIMTHKNGELYDGEWYDGVREGKGIYNFSNGAVYDGEWANDKRNGLGKLTYQDGDTYDGVWENEIFKEGTCTITKEKYTYRGKCSMNQNENEPSFEKHAIITRTNLTLYNVKGNELAQKKTDIGLFQSKELKDDTQTRGYYDDTNQFIEGYWVEGKHSNEPPLPIAELVPTAEPYNTNTNTHHNYKKTTAKYVSPIPMVDANLISGGSKSKKKRRRHYTKRV